MGCRFPGRRRCDPVVPGRRRRGGRRDHDRRRRRRDNYRRRRRRHNYRCVFWCDNHRRRWCRCHDRRSRCTQHARDGSRDESRDSRDHLPGGAVVVMGFRLEVPGHAQGDDQCRDDGGVGLLHDALPFSASAVVLLPIASNIRIKRMFNFDIGRFLNFFSRAIDSSRLHSIAIEKKGENEKGIRYW